MDVTAEDLRARIAKRIEDLMLRRHMNRSDLATASDVSRSHLYRIMDGRTAPSSDVLARIAAALRVDPVELVRPFKGKPPALQSK